LQVVVLRRSVADEVSSELHWQISTFSSAAASVANLLINLMASEPLGPLAISSALKALAFSITSNMKQSATYPLPKQQTILIMTFSKEKLESEVR